jgi:alpha/beta superfamily hydrolase
MRQEERDIALPVSGSAFALEGVYVRGDGPEPPGAVIAAPHPLYGGSMASPVVVELAWACRRAGYTTLSFNWRGVGASAGAPSGEAADADADYTAALEHLAETTPGELLAAGYSFGAAAAVRAASRHSRVRRLALVAPPPALLDTSALDAFPGSALLVVGGVDAFAPVAELEARVAERPERHLQVVPEADHFFAVGLGEIGRAVAAWLGRPAP